MVNCIYIEFPNVSGQKVLTFDETHVKCLDVQIYVRETLKFGPRDYIRVFLKDSGERLNDDFLIPRTCTVRVEREPKNSFVSTVTVSNVPLSPVVRPHIVKTPPPGYCCRLCSIPGHYYQDCSKFVPKKTLRAEHASLSELQRDTMNLQQQTLSMMQCGSCSAKAETKTTFVSAIESYRSDCCFRVMCAECALSASAEMCGCCQSTGPIKYYTVKQLHALEDEKKRKAEFTKLLLLKRKQPS